MQRGAPLAAADGAAALALGAAVSLGLARFSYALLLPPMRADLGWSYLTAGAMNTVNAAGYLAGALLAPRALARFDARALLLGGALRRRAAAGGARPGPRRRRAVRAALPVAAWPARPPSSAAGCWRRGWSAARGRAWCSASTTAAPAWASSPRRCWCRRWRRAPCRTPGRAPGWRWAAAALLATAVAARGHACAGGAAGCPARRARRCAGPPSASAWPATCCFGLGYIGYMTFIVTLLREQQVPAARRSSPSTSCSGWRVVASSWLWAGLLQR